MAPRYDKGTRVFCVLQDQSIFRGVVLTHRGLEVRVRSEDGTVRSCHGRSVFLDPEFPLTKQSN